MEILTEIFMYNECYVLRYNLITHCLLDKDIEGSCSNCRTHFGLNLMDLFTKGNFRFNLFINFGHQNL